ncbi:phospholipid:diacylglycerol acyltransferase 1 [Tanacetum coccineum]
MGAGETKRSLGWLGRDGEEVRWLEEGGAWCGRSDRSGEGEHFWSSPENSPEIFSGDGGVGQRRLGGGRPWLWWPDFIEEESVRRVSGLVAADYFAPGYFGWAVLIANFARVGYEEKNMYMAAYDWRLSFQNTEVRERTLSRLKRNIEMMVEINGGEKAVIIPHSMGVRYFLHFMKWVEAPAPMGGGGGSDWCAKHIKAVMNIGGPLLGAPKALAGLFSAEAKDIAFARGIAPVSTQNESNSKVSQAKNPNYGRLISIGRDIAESHSSQIERVDFRGAIKGNNHANKTCRDVWTEYHEMGLGGIKAITDYKAYTAGDLVDLLEFVAPKMMERGNVPCELIKLDIYGFHNLFSVSIINLKPS